MTREEAIEILKKDKPTSDPRLCGKELCQACNLAIAALQEPERKHGEWMGTVCSCCGKSTVDYYDCDFCPKCGAIMDGKEK